LVIATASCAKTAGSKCILCTDGLANVGVGSLENGGEELYKEVGLFAKRKGVIVSVISIKGSDTKLEKLGALADITKGQVDLVDPVNLNFSGLLSSEVFATNVVVDVFISRNFTLTREQDWVKHEHYTKISRDIGNAVPSSQTTFEFSVLGKDEVPDKFLVQIQISYTKLNGNKYRRVYTEQRATSTNLPEVIQNLDIQTISTHLAKTSAGMARLGDYEGALKNAVNVKALVEQRINTDEDKALWNIFMVEFEDISKALTTAIDKEKKAGSRVSERSSMRSDYTAKKLYNYSSAEAKGCVVQ